MHANNITQTEKDTLFMNICVSIYTYVCRNTEKRGYEFEGVGEGAYGKVW